MNIALIAILWGVLDYSYSDTESCFNENCKHFVFEKFEKSSCGLQIFKISIGRTSEGYIVDKTVRKGHAEKAIAESINENELKVIQETIKELKKTDR